MSNSRYLVVPRDLLERAVMILHGPYAKQTAAELRDLLDQPDAIPDQGAQQISHAEMRAALLADEERFKRLLDGVASSTPWYAKEPRTDNAYVDDLIANTPETPKAAPQKVEGNPGTWGHCGKKGKHGPHVRKPFAMNEGVYENVQCNGTPGSL